MHGKFWLRQLCGGRGMMAHNLMKCKLIPKLRPCLLRCSAVHQLGLAPTPPHTFPHKDFLFQNSLFIFLPMFQLSIIKIYFEVLTEKAACQKIVSTYYKPQTADGYNLICKEPQPQYLVSAHSHYILQSVQ